MGWYLGKINKSLYFSRSYNFLLYVELLSFMWFSYNVSGFACGASRPRPLIIISHILRLRTRNRGNKSVNTCGAKICH